MSVIYLVLSGALIIATIFALPITMPLVVGVAIALIGWLGWTIFLNSTSVE